jgi:hypothetical protein
MVIAIVLERQFHEITLHEAAMTTNEWPTLRCEDLCPSNLVGVIVHACYVRFAESANFSSWTSNSASQI